MSTRTQGGTDPGLEPLLNVIFHGSFAFVFGQHGIEAMTPDVEEHVYKAGTFGLERRLTQGRTYHLSGVTPAHKAPDIDHAQNVTFNVHQINRNPLFCSFVLPFPDKMTPFRFLLNPVFQDREGTELPMQGKVPDVQVLTYRIAPHGRLSMGGFSWMPGLREDTNTVNFHVFAYEEFPVENSRQHYQDSGTVLMSMFPDLGIIPLRATKDDNYYAKIDPGIRGIEPDELGDLIERSLNLPPGYVLTTRTVPLSAPTAMVSTGGWGPIPIQARDLPDCLSFIAMQDGGA